jgi:alpha-amylase
MNSEKNLISDRQLVLCFQIHQPRRLKEFSGTGEGSSWLDVQTDQKIMQRIARECYLPANALLLRLAERYPQIRISFSISGTAIEQMEEYAPEVLESFKTLAATGCVDFLAETYYHSMAFLMEGDEFEIQILEHAEKMVEHFGVRPAVFRNTNLIYNDDIGRRISMMGFQGVLTEGYGIGTGGKSPHFLYEHRDLNGLKILMRNPQLSDDIAFRVALSDWHLTAEKYLSWLDAMPENEKLVTIAVDYETFGEHHKTSSGIFHFLENFLLLLSIGNGYKMATPAEITSLYKAHSPISIPGYIAVAGSDLSHWVGNQKQRDAFAGVIEIESAVKIQGDSELTRLWRYLQACDHFYHMADKADQAIHLSPYNSSQEAYDHYMRVVNTLREKVNENIPLTVPEKLNEALESDRRNIHAPLWALNIDSRNGFVN